jgi:phosphatidylserine/phosphatidylglycerophosphate/cardiolipin synthase-like enzyme
MLAMKFLVSICAAALATLGLAAAQGELELVETPPVETTLDHADLRNADVVWLEMFARARKSIDLGEFYVSNQAGSKLEGVVQALEAAAARGVHVRLLADAKFAKTYPETLERIAKHANCEVRRWEVGKSFGGGVLHAKYFVVDRSELFVGSQNFDWRSLEHVLELGLRVADAKIAGEFQAVFDADWQIAGDAPVEGAVATTIGALEPEVATIAGAKVSARFSPLAGVPDERWWDLPELVRWIDGAKTSVRVEVMTYKPLTYDKTFWGELDNALRRAAARGVKVQLLCADWCKRAGTIEGLQSLEPLANVEVRMVTIPAHSSGHIPYGRVIHAKYMTVDGARAWLGTSNWERDYFEESRNMSLFVEGGALCGRLERFFDELWSSPYAYAVDPSAKYQPPKIGE